MTRLLDDLRRLATPLMGCTRTLRIPGVGWCEAATTAPGQERALESAYAAFPEHVVVGEIPVTVTPDWRGDWAEGIPEMDVPVPAEATRHLADGWAFHFRRTGRGLGWVVFGAPAEVAP